MPRMANFTMAVKQLEKERGRLTAELERINKALAVLGASRFDGQSRRRKLSAAALGRIRAAQKARWAKWRKSHKKGKVAG